MPIASLVNPDPVDQRDQALRRLTGDLNQFLAARSDFIRHAMQLRGGWEGWAQVELALFLSACGYDVEREANIFADANRRIDLLIGWQGQFLGLEVKCETAAGAAGFYAEVDADLTKIVEQGPRCSAGQLIFGRAAALTTMWNQLSMQGVDGQRLRRLTCGERDGLKWMICCWPPAVQIAPAGGLPWRP